MTGLYERLSSPGTLWFEATASHTRYADSLLFSDPLEALPLYAGDDIHAWFDRLEFRLDEGRCLAGWIGYEAGAGLDAALAGCSWPEDRAGLLGWFGVYRAPESLDRAGIEAADASASSGRYLVSSPEFELDETAYTGRIAALKEEIAAGNVYQVNFTGRFRFGFEGRPESLYVDMKRLQPSAWSAFLNTGDRIVLSFSPELFFTLDGKSIETMPMKGTAPRGGTAEEDTAERERLAACEKNRAENLMIVDLLRNDLGRICRPGSVSTTGLFETQTYPTLHQMVSTVRGELREETGLYDLFRAIFPSGSITGAPKVRAMHLIRSLETSPRGVYTGAIGFMLPGGRMAFNVAIRTIELSGGQGVYGTGSGVVWDSDPHHEYLECLLKAKILSDRALEVPGIFETILWNGAWLLPEDHLDRMEDSSSKLGLTFDRDEARKMLETLDRELAGIGGTHRVRLELDRTEGLSVSSRPFIPDPAGQPVRVCYAGERVDSADPLLRHKVTCRDLYERALHEAAMRGCGETIFLNERGEVTEGAISNLVVCLDGQWYTPPLSSGLLHGVYRRYLLRTRPWIIERALRPDDLLRADVVLLCNALRGQRVAEITALH
ncbi:MAG: aminodeoxychorismate synthase component I [Chlorobiaceae bacterium]|nr:aminodeoxychorismate synthase component I [Chlorobiaceae bacterium]